jgi:hypothetical protein
MVDLLVLTSLYKLFLVLKILFTFVTKQPNLIRRSTVLSLPLPLAFPAQAYQNRKTQPRSLNNEQSSKSEYFGLKSVLFTFLGLHSIGLIVHCVKMHCSIARQFCSI